MNNLDNEGGNPELLTPDNGHDALVLDIQVLTQEVEDHAFHDFKNEKYAAPKVALRTRLLELAENVVQGKYDN